MNRKTVERMKKVCGVLGFMAFLLLLGTMGAMEANKVSFGTGVLRGLLCLLVLYVSLRGYAGLNEYKDKLRKEERLRIEREIQRIQNGQYDAQCDEKMRKLLGA